MFYYQPKYFRLYELVPETIYKKVPYHILWQLFDPRILKSADMVRKHCGPMVGNTWFHGGSHYLRGLRPFGSLIGATYSQHKFGRAEDLVPVKTTAEDVRKFIIANPELFPYITAIEIDVPWVHIDCRNWDVSTHGILLINP